MKDGAKVLYPSNEVEARPIVILGHRPLGCGYV